MEILSNNIGIFGEDGGSKVEEKLEGGSGDWEEIENQLKKERIKYKPSSSVMNQSHSLFKMEAKFNIKSYHGEINALKLNHLLQQLEFYFNVHQIEEGQIFHLRS